jgi:hypothetical protein
MELVFRSCRVQGKGVATRGCAGCIEYMWGSVPAGLLSCQGRIDGRVGEQDGSLRRGSSLEWVS